MTDSSSYSGQPPSSKGRLAVRLEARALARPTQAHRRVAPNAHDPCSWLSCFFGPVVWIMLTALKQPRDVYSLSVLFTPTLDNLRAAFASPYFPRQPNAQ
jgi:hypothetical protein